MSDLRTRTIRLAHEQPALREHLLPMIRTAEVFPTQDAYDKYMKEHPKADKKRHSIQKNEEGQSKGEGKKKEMAYDEVHKVHLDGITQEEFNNWLNHPEGKELQSRYNLHLLAGSDGVVSKTDLERAISVRRKFKALIDAQEKADAEEAKAESEGKPKPQKPGDDVCKVTPKVCHKNLGIERSSMPQFSPPGESIKSMRKAMPDARFKEIVADIKKRGKRQVTDALDDAERELYYKRENAESAIAAGADPTSEKGTFDMFLDRLKDKGIKIKDLTKKGMAVKDLHATQAEIRASKAYANADKYLAGKNTDENGNLITEPADIIYVSSDNHILDGHHRWSGFLLANPNASIPVIKIGMPMKELLEESFQSPGVFRQNFRFEVVPEDDPLDLARKSGETWKQRNGKWYGKNKQKAGGPFESKESAQEYAAGKKAASLRAAVIRLASTHPEFRQTLLPLLA